MARAQAYYFFVAIVSGSIADVGILNSSVEAKDKDTDI